MGVFVSGMASVLILVISTFFITALKHNVSIGESELLMASTKCVDNGGLDKYSFDLSGEAVAYCNNGAKFEYKRAGSK